MAERICVIGAGAAGMTAAIAAAESGASVTVYEKNRLTGKKLRITGKGRCNVTNNCTPAEFIREVTKNSKFLYGAINRFSGADTIEFFESMGVPLKTERGRRVFPESDRAADIADALEKRMRSLGVEYICAAAKDISPADGGFEVRTSAGTELYGAVIVATGGASYPGTGSTGDGYRFARKLGLEVTEISPSLVPIVTEEDTSPMMGLSLKNVVLTVTDSAGKCVFSEQGEMMFTHFGVTGPLVLSASAHMRPDPSAYRMEIDMKCALDDKTLDRRISSDLEKNSARDFINSLGALLPSSIIEETVRRSGIEPRKKCAQITREERASLGRVIKHFTLTPTKFRPIAEAIVTSGGVAVGELSPKSMMAKSVPGLFFAGEVIDVDAYTGGYNLQIAFSTAMAAGTAAAEYIFEEMM